MVMIFELIDPRPYKSLSPVYWRLINTVICMSSSKSKAPFDLPTRYALPPDPPDLFRNHGNYAG